MSNKSKSFNFINVPDLFYQVRNPLTWNYITQCYNEIITRLQCIIFSNLTNEIRVYVIRVSIDISDSNTNICQT